MLNNLGGPQVLVFDKLGASEAQVLDKLGGLLDKLDGPELQVLKVKVLDKQDDPEVQSV